ncbi:MAG: 50S ribosomal protein L21 [Candidatus Taylorbacteria bacterium RIFCSPLOWO2_02_FULL_43_11]|uniref:Large ribosomal subunit protein bL21 n=1 Tax=Candidatus Taylorbacteria bacterium RIFCSPHIGHO2_02_FULL_43_32b TaxID=1802306 RepID=A0A1G2MLT5_9BACT|nr:MAG: 50S ribosomal protein L21 [Candidatus Taylorbacteria bacterium RIFCSPHIGHO2_01_FULL_43_47]OHA24817.1 MAG: 50S ribosomal protein L21 [Candidatus Taylorbacteria bacterium RIFCSPHIGHO2_02_FULL_43_32b]OHA31858.1 MAG: 50S ribosomal protein L21 [Candidatus Taylorbacteria bacterium RIFCSPLOWO2_01_FULL_43_44]OHA35651.1 MAG: 50S ribosomal protein L21 [Candidatus Taylorbacteria bacterium RIFCSPLOWO2_02_FULL_43_11]
MAEKKTKKTGDSQATESFAVIKTGGKQYKVKEGDTLNIEKIEGKAKGDKISFDDVLLIDNGTTSKVGMPLVAGATVDGEILDAGRNQKVVVIHYKQKSRYYKKAGHRQHHLKVKITGIKG